MNQSKDGMAKQLGLFDVFAVSTGAMFSAGFFILPGIAAMKSGPSVALAYVAAGLLLIPAMCAKAELSAAMPKAGGPYYFLDRSFGPTMGTIGGLGTYLALVLKTSFALIGMGAYLQLWVNTGFEFLGFSAIQLFAVFMTVAFGALNVFGAKESHGLQRWMVMVIIFVLTIFLVAGLKHVFVDMDQNLVKSRFTPAFPEGANGFLATIGFVVLSYTGITKVASVAEEVKNPDRNMPLGMVLSLAFTVLVYGVAVAIMTAVLPQELFHDTSDPAPVARAAHVTMQWGGLGFVLVEIVAIGAFASAANAGIMSASRYPLAMGRDRLISDKFGKLSRFQSPMNAIMLTVLLMCLIIMFLPLEKIAKLASAFLLLIFAMVNGAVIVMRESRIPSYDPGWRAPFYPWMQVFGILVSVVLIIYMGWLAILFTAGIIVACLMWFTYYAKDRVVRDGAIYHWFERLGHRRYEGLDYELRGILKEKGLRAEDPFDAIVARASVIDLPGRVDFEEVTRQVSEEFSRICDAPTDSIAEEFLKGTRMGVTPVTHGVALPHVRLSTVDQIELVLVRAGGGVDIVSEDPMDKTQERHQTVFALFFLASPEADPGQHLRILASIAGRVDEESFLEEWTAARDEQQLKEVLLREDRYLSLDLQPDMATAALIGLQIRDLRFPEGCLIALIRRGGRVLVPLARMTLQEGDRLTIIGDTEQITEMTKQFVSRSDDDDESHDEDDDEDGGNIVTKTSGRIVGDDYPPVISTGNAF